MPAPDGVTGTTIKERGRAKLNPATSTKTESRSGWAKDGAGGPLFLIVVNAASARGRLTKIAHSLRVSALMFVSLTRAPGGTRHHSNLSSVWSNRAVGYCSNPPANLNESQKFLLPSLARDSCNQKSCVEAVMGYWKFTNAEALAAWEKTRADEAQMRKEAADLTSILGGKPVFKSDLTRSTFYGVNFDAAPYLAKELWTVPTGNTGYASWPKARPPKGMKEEHAAVKKLWSEHYPKTQVSNDEFYESIGLDWGMLILCGITLFRHGDAIYVQTGATPKPAFGAVEIVGSEFDKARREYSDAKA